MNWHLSCVLQYNKVVNVKKRESQGYSKLQEIFVQKHKEMNSHANDSPTLGSCIQLIRQP